MACFTSGRRQAPSTILGWPASPSLSEIKPLILGATLILLGALIYPFSCILAGKKADNGYFHVNRTKNIGTCHSFLRLKCEDMCTTG